jgi:hypothetical protein
VNIHEVLSPELRFYESFLFARTADWEHTAFNFLVSRVAIGELLFTGIGIAFTRNLKRSAPRVWGLMFLLTLTSALLMTRVSTFIWNLLPKLQFLQFPWRWLIVLGVPFSLFLTAAMARMNRSLFFSFCSNGSYEPSEAIRLDCCIPSDDSGRVR